jgi:hypothetical protein
MAIQKKSALYLIVLTHFERIVHVISGGEKLMKRLKLWSLVAGLALDGLVGCSRASRNSPGASDGIRSDREVAEGGRDIDGTKVPGG